MYCIAKFILVTLFFLIFSSSPAQAQWSWDDPLVADLKPEEISLLKEWATEFPRLVEKYSQLTIEYTHRSEKDGKKTEEINRIFILGQDHYRWDKETPEGTAVTLSLPNRCYRFAKEKGEENYFFVGQGDEKKSKEIIRMILSTDVVRAPIANGFVPLWYSFPFLDKPSFEHIWFEETRKAASKVSLKFKTVNDEVLPDKHRVTLTAESTIDGKTRTPAVVLLKSHAWALETSELINIDQTGQEYKRTNTREYEGDVDGIPLLKSVTILAHSTKDNKLGWGDWYTVTKLDLSPPDKSVFDPNQFVPNIGVIEATNFTVVRIICIVSGVLLISIGLWLKFRRPKTA